MTRPVVLRLLFTGLCLFAGGAAHAAAAPPPPDDDPQDLVRQVLELDRDLRVLEERALYPAETRLSVFLSMDLGIFFKLESVRLEIDDQEVSTHRFTDAEVAALVKGATPMLYVGNTRKGAHRMTAVFTGIGPHDRAYRRALEVNFDHFGEPRLLELRIRDGEDQQQPLFVVGRMWR